MTLKEMPKVGEKVRVISGGFNSYVTIGKVYEIDEFDGGFACFIDDEGDEDNRSFIAEGNFDKFELVVEPSEETPVEASPTVIELLANISRRLYEAEQTIKEHAYEINELYKAVADRG